MAKNRINLIEYLNKEFSRIDGNFKDINQRFKDVNQRLDIIESHSGWVKEQLKVVNARLDGMDVQIDDLRKKFSAIQDSLDAYAKKAHDYFQEMTIFSGQISRHENWIKKLAGEFRAKLGS